MTADQPTPEASEARAREPLLRLVLTGFMGSGKTTVGRLLAAELGWRFVDLDDRVEQAAGRSVAHIFADSGEPAFRELETASLRSALRESHVVLALGGGALETPANRELLAASSQTLVILLTAPFATLYDRCARQNAESNAQRNDSSLPVRPLLGDPESAAARLARRDAIYRSAAGLVIETTGQTPEQTLRSVLRSIESWL